MVRYKFEQYGSFFIMPHIYTNRSSQLRERHQITIALTMIESKTVMMVFRGRLASSLAARLGLSAERDLKCPGCGEPLLPGQARCYTCGYADPDFLRLLENEMPPGGVSFAADLGQTESSKSGRLAVQF